MIVLSYICNDRHRHPEIIELLLDFTICRVRLPPSKNQEDGRTPTEQYSYLIGFSSVDDVKIRKNTETNKKLNTRNATNANTLDWDGVIERDPRLQKNKKISRWDVIGFYKLVSF